MNIKQTDTTVFRVGSGDPSALFRFAADWLDEHDEWALEYAVTEFVDEDTGYALLLSVFPFKEPTPKGTT